MSRTQYLIRNARINVAFYLANIVVTFFSRKLFIDSLGADFLGLNATITNLLGFLSLAELGIGTAITYLLYKPLARQDFREANEIINLLNYYYKRLGLTITVLGLILSCFLLLIFGKSNLPTGVIYVAFYSYLTINLIEYLFNFKQLLVYADQKAFLLKKTLGLCNILKIMFQVVAIFVFKPNLYIFLGIEAGFGIIKSVALNHLITKTYPWLLISKIKNNNPHRKHDLLKKTKQIFSHQIGGFVLTQTDQLLIYTYTSLKMVTFYNNYLIIVQYAVTLATQPFLSLNSGIGNLVASADKEKSYKVFRELLLLKYWLAGCVIFILYQTIDPFIMLWLGENYLLGHNITIILLLNFFINIVRKPLDVFLQAFGIFHDIWAPWAEAGLNLILSVSLGYLYGIFGILLGTFISVGLIVCLWKPYLLFKQGFGLPAQLYFKKVLIYITLFLIAATISLYTTKQLTVNIAISNKYLLFTAKLCITATLFITLYSLLLYFFVKESKQLLNRFSTLWK